MKPVRVWIGFVLVAFGLLWLLDAVGVLDARPVIDGWWPVAVIALGFIAVAAGRRLAPGPVALILIGTGLLISELTIVDVSRIIWPSMAVIVGGWLLIDFARRRGDRAPNASDRQDAFALLGGCKVSNRSAQFRHANVSAVFGGATLDLQEATLQPGARVDALALFGGVEVIVPIGWRVELSGLPIFGGYEDKTRGQHVLAPDAPVLTVVATALFGGVEVKNPDRADAGITAGTTTSAFPGSDLR